MTGLALAQGRIEVKQFARTRESLVFTLVFPAIILLIFGAIFSGDIDGISFKQYFAAGMIASGLMSSGFQNLAITIPIERDRGVLKRYRSTPMPKWVFFAGKIIQVGVIGFFATVILLVIGMFYGLDLPSSPEKWFTLLWVWLLGLTACTLLGIAFSAAARTGRSGPAVVTPIALILQFISGVFFPFTQLPHWMQQIAAFFPLKWICQGMRAAFLPDSFAASEPAGSFELGKVALILGAWCIVGLVASLLFFRWTTKRDG
ncbi:ABC-2 type transport system permease protein [Hamadaea flava]|uniref:Transport permease protein n=1 Tax=Hamadaea flava TaxID=1742688 RepID=A0ABV8LKB9_9ACTN|nr:ABC transporter permease [Hamadaea flava]MCP2325112.1 ABC-2 type transport system permease protein [Hamadaea flava]